MGERVRSADAGRVLVNVEITIQVRAEFHPDAADALCVELDFGTVTLFEQFGAQRVHAVRRQALAAFDALVNLQFKPRQRRHHEEVAVKIAKRFLEHRELKLWIGVFLE